MSSVVLRERGASMTKLVCDGFTVTTDSDKQEMTFVRMVGTVKTTTTIGWVDGNLLEVVAAMKRRDAGRLEFAKKIGLSY